MTKRKQEIIRAEKRRLQKARVEWKKANPGAADKKRLGDLSEQKHAAIKRDDHQYIRTIRQNEKRLRYDANLRRLAAAGGTSSMQDRMELRKSIIAARRNPKTDPKRMTFLATLRQLTRIRMLRAEKAIAR